MVNISVQHGSEVYSAGRVNSILRNNTNHTGFKYCNSDLEYVYLMDS